jgi:ABC-2 type transport system permease protein
VAVVVPQFFRFFTDVGRDGLESAGGVLAWTPPGLAARAAVEAGSGHLAVALAWLAGAVAVVGLLAWWWMSALDRSLTTTSPTGGAKNGRRSPGLFAPAWAWLPRDRLGAVAAKELRYYGRDPRQRAGTLVWLLFAIALPVGVVLSDLGERPEIVLAASALAALGGLASVNQYGFEGGAHWMNVVAGTDARSDLAGKNLALAAWVMAVVTAVAVALAAVSGGWVWVPVTLLVSAGVLGVAIGVGNVFSVRAPQPMPTSNSNLFAANTGQGCIGGLLQLLAVVSQGVLLLPVVGAVAAALAWWLPAMAIVVPVSLAWGYLCWRRGLAVAVRWLEPRHPEFLDSLSPRRTG